MATEQRRRPRVVVLGLDGASLELLGPWIREGLMPNLSRLIERGVSGGLESVIPPLTPPAWTTAVTGVQPARHGVLNFAKPRFGRRVLEFYGGRDRIAPALWDYLGAAGKRSIVLHLPAAHPPVALDGVMISGIPVTRLASDCVYPPSLKDDLVENVPGYKLFPDTVLLRRDKEAYFRDAVATLHAQVEETSYLMRREAWDLLFTVWQPGDSLMHFFWRDMDGRGEESRRNFIRDYYREADAGIGRIVEEAGEDTHVVVMSDHGHTGVRGAVYVNRWLIENGFLKFSLPVSQLLEFFAVKLQRKFGRRFIRRRQIDENADPAMQIAGRLLEKLESGIVWPKTVAHAEPPGYVWICTKDRYPQGSVEPGEEYLRVREEIRRGLLAIRDPKTGEPMFRGIATKEEAFDGPAAGNAPDLVLLGRPGIITEYNPMKKIIVGPAVGTTFNGYHVMRGMFVAAGPGLRAGAEIEGARILDVAPTILHLLGQPVPRAMEGAVLRDALDPDALAHRPVRVEDVAVAFAPEARGEDERDTIEQSLRDLGYM